MKELRKALLSFMFAGGFIVCIYKVYNQGIIEKYEDIWIVIEMIMGYTSIILIIFGFYQSYKFCVYLYYKKNDNLLVLEYSKELWKQFVRNETKRRLIGNMMKFKKTLIVIPLLIICLFLALADFNRKDTMTAEGILDSSFQVGILTIFISIIIFALIWYGVAPLLFYVENIFSRRPYVMANKNCVLLNGELYQWKNKKDNHIVERKILNGNVVQIKYQTSTSRFNDITFRFPIPNDKRSEVAKYIHII